MKERLPSGVLPTKSIGLEILQRQTRIIQTTNLNLRGISTYCDVEKASKVGSLLIYSVTH